MKTYTCRACFNEGDVIVKEYATIYADSVFYAKCEIEKIYPNADYYEVQAI